MLTAGSPSRLCAQARAVDVLAGTDPLPSRLSSLMTAALPLPL